MKAEKLRSQRTKKIEGKKEKKRGVSGERKTFPHLLKSYWGGGKGLKRPTEKILGGKKK